MDSYYIKLKCFETSGYFTGTIMNSTGIEVGVHPYKQRAKKFNSFNEALATAKYLKTHFKCIISYEVLNNNL